MIIKKGTLLEVSHKRKGRFKAMAYEDFRPDTKEFYPLMLQDERIESELHTWHYGDKIPCKKDLCSIKVI